MWILANAVTKSSDITRQPARFPQVFSWECAVHGGPPSLSQAATYPTRVILPDLEYDFAPARMHRGPCFPREVAHGHR
jgi:hypothetical protein